MKSRRTCTNGTPTRSVSSLTRLRASVDDDTYRSPGSISQRMSSRYAQIDSGTISGRVTSVATKPSPSRSRTVEQLAVVWQARNGAESSNPIRSTPQSPRIHGSWRLARNMRVCARFAIRHGPGERSPERESPRLGKTYLLPILLGPSIPGGRRPGAVM
jgi:hypothetical protein